MNAITVGCENKTVWWNFELLITHFVPAMGTQPINRKLFHSSSSASQFPLSLHNSVSTYDWSLLIRGSKLKNSSTKGQSPAQN